MILLPIVGSACILASLFLTFKFLEEEIKLRRKTKKLKEQLLFTHKVNLLIVEELTMLNQFLPDECSRKIIESRIVYKECVGRSASEALTDLQLSEL